MILFGDLLVGVGWIVNAYTARLGAVCRGGVLRPWCGRIYATCVGNAVKWFPDRRGLAVGLTAAGFGAGAALTVIPIRMVIAGYG